MGEKIYTGIPDALIIIIALKFNRDCLTPISPCVHRHTHFYISEGLLLHSQCRSCSAILRGAPPQHHGLTAPPVPLPGTDGKGKTDVFTNLYKRKAAERRAQSGGERGTEGGMRGRAAPPPLRLPAPAAPPRPPRGGAQPPSSGRSHVLPRAAFPFLLLLLLTESPFKAFQ